MPPRRPSWRPDRHRAILARDAVQGRLYFTRGGDVAVKLPEVWELRDVKLTRAERASLRRTAGKAPKSERRRIDLNAGLWEHRPRDGGPHRIRRLAEGTPLWDTTDQPAELTGALVSGRDPRLDPVKGDRLWSEHHQRTVGPVRRVDHRRSLVDYGEGWAPLRSWRNLWDCVQTCRRGARVEAAEPGEAATAAILTPLDEDAADRLRREAAAARSARGSAARSAPRSKPRCRRPPGGRDAWQRQLDEVDHACRAEGDCIADRFRQAGLAAEWARLTAATNGSDPAAARTAWDVLHSALERVRPRKVRGAYVDLLPAFRSNVCGDDPLDSWRFLDDALHAAEPIAEASPRSSATPRYRGRKVPTPARSIADAEIPF